MVAGCAGDDGSTGRAHDAQAKGAAARKVPSLQGTTWSGHRQRLSSTEGYRDGSATLTVTKQTGRTFEGTMQWSTPDGPVREGLVGAFTPGAALMAGADAEGTYSFKLVDRTTLDYCYTEHGEGYRTTCARLKRQR
jgi:hypothetical protein